MDMNPLDALRERIKRHGSQKAAAKALGVSPQFLNDMVKERRQVPARLLRKLGLKRVVVAATALLALVTIGCGYGGSPIAPSAPATPKLPFAWTGQSNAEGVEPFLATAYGGPIVGAWQGSTAIAFWGPNDRMWAQLAPTLHQALVAAGIWQGESDGNAPGEQNTPPATYAAAFADLMTRIRSENQNPTLLIVVVLVGPYAGLDQIRAIQESWVAQDAHARLVNIDDLPTKPGEVHLTDAGYQAAAGRIVSALR